MLKEKYTEKDVANLIAQVEEAFTSQLAKAETSLAKSEDGESHKEEHKEKRNTKKSLNMKLRNMSPKHMKAKTNMAKKAKSTKAMIMMKKTWRTWKKCTALCLKANKKPIMIVFKSVWG